MADKSYLWDEDFLAENPNEDTGKVRWSGNYINSTREALDERLKDEHVWDKLAPAPQNRMGAHKAGSGVSYYGGSTPGLRPDGVTALDTDDAGRIWFDSGNGQIKGWNGTAWVNLSAQGIGTILRWQSDAQYQFDEIVESNGVLWVAVDNPPILGTPPVEPIWTLFSIPMPNNMIWFDPHIYFVDEIVFHSTGFWKAIAPIAGSAPGLVGGEWTQVLTPTTHIADDAVTQPKIGPQAVGTDELQDGKVTTVKIADLNVTTGKLEDNAVTTIKLTDLNVTTAKLEDDAVTTIKITDLNVTTAKINDLAVTEGKLATDAVTLAKLGLDAQDVILWRADVTYNENDIVNRNGAYYICTDAGGSDVGVAPADGSGKWERWDATTEETITDTATITAGRPAHVVYGNTTVNNKILTINDGYLASDRLTVVAVGGYDITLTMTGLAGAEVPASEARSYIWSGTDWYLASGGGGDLGSLYVPQPKTWVEKWNDGGAGNITSKLNEWGTGRFIVTLVDSNNDGHTNIIDTRDDTVDVNKGQQIDDHNTTHALVYLDRADDTFKMDENSPPTYYFQSISVWELDPDNVALVTVPSDPSLIKDWVEEYDDDTYTVQSLSYPVADGNYEVLISNGTNSYTAKIIIDSNRTACYASWTSNGELKYTTATGLWDSNTAGYGVQRIRHWEDVAGADAQMNPPIDGWEIKVDDDSRTGPITNSWRAGTYDFLVKNFNSTDDLYCALTISEVDIAGSEKRFSSNYSGASNSVSVVYDASANTFDVFNAGTYGGEITRLRKFNSLVNVLHLYHPDPRQVAQKDWVEKFYDYTNTADVVNSWGSGDFKYVFQLSGGADKYTGHFTLNIDELSAGDEVHSAQYISTSGNRLTYMYDYDTNTFTIDENLGASYYIAEIHKYEDSQASDSPRVVLDDGEELVYDDETNTNLTLVSSVIEGGIALGKYRLSLSNGAIRTSCFLNVDDLGSDIYFPSTSGGVHVVRYDTSSNAFIATATAIVKIWRLTGQLTINANYNAVSLSDGPNQVLVRNTDAGDVNLTLPSSPSLTDLYEVWNTGTNGYHVNITTDGSTLYNGLAIGDGKGIRLRYVDGWKYEDVIIDEEDGAATGTGFSAGTYHNTLWAGGKIVTDFYLQPNGGATVTIPTLPVAFTSTTYIMGTMDNPVDTVGRVVTFHSNLGATAFRPSVANNNGNVTNNYTYTRYEGRWKTGV